MEKSETKQCQNCKKNFTIESEDFAFYDRAGVPYPMECPQCRRELMASFWVFGKFRIAKSSLSDKNIITVLPESAHFPIYDRKEWFSDAWDAMDYGQDYDPSRPFFEQVKQLQSKVPKPHAVGENNVDCDWSDDVWSSKNCYLTRSVLEGENLNYCYRVVNSKDSTDLTYSFKIDKSYDLLYCFDCYNTKYSFDARNCIDSMFLADSRNCQNCFMSWNLRNKQYCILNKQYTKEEYFKKLEEFDTKSYIGVQKLRAEFDRIMREEMVHRANLNTKDINSTGNILSNVKNCADAYYVEESENSRHLLRGISIKDSIDVLGSFEVEKVTLAMGSVGNYDTLSTVWCVNCRYSSYLDLCIDCEYCFGCVGLRKKKYCILNKQYSEEEYKKLIVTIQQDMEKSGEWGKFFPSEFASSGYNMSLGQMLFPKTKEETLAFGGRWDSPDIQEYSGAIKSSALPDSIDEVSSEITKERIICEETGLSYNISKGELEFYKQHGIPLPRQHFDYRTKKRFDLIAKMIKPQNSKCIFCNEAVEHYYAPELGFQKVACVECYNREIV